MKNWLFLCSVLIGLTSCNNDIIYKEPELVIEGWIDAGGFPKVIVTTTLPITEEKQDIDDIKDHVIRWAKVTINDGEREVVLTGKSDKKFEPPYIYTTTDMKGEVGKSYRLTVKYKNFYAEATTTVPHPVALKSLEAVPTSSPQKYKIVATVEDPKEEKNFYKFFNRRYSEQSYYLSFYPSVFDDLTPEITQGVTITRGNRSMEELDSPFFDVNDSVLVKVGHIDEQSFHFWKDYEQNSALGRNPLFTQKENIRSNIIGGLGYWCGYGANEYMVIIKDHINNKNKE